MPPPAPERASRGLPRPAARAQRLRRPSCAPSPPLVASSAAVCGDTSTLLLRRLPRRSPRRRASPSPDPSFPDPGDLLELLSGRRALQLRRNPTPPPDASGPVGQIRAAARSQSGCATSAPPASRAAGPTEPIAGHRGPYTAARAQRLRRPSCAPSPPLVTSSAAVSGDLDPAAPPPPPPKPSPPGLPLAGS
nr:atherin-like [Aegilops tauschii subsp. strangulata]